MPTAPLTAPSEPRTTKPDAPATARHRRQRSESGSFRQGISDIDLWIERQTERTPANDKRHYLFYKGTREGPFSLKRAKARYDELRKASGYQAPERAPLDPSLTLAHERQYMGQLKDELWWVDYRQHRSHR